MTHHDPWLTDWLTQPLSALPAGVSLDTEAMVMAIQVYRQWHERGGLERLQRQAARLSRDSDQVMDALNETWLDIRERMVGCVERAVNGRSFPKFQTIKGVEKYHWIQLRLRLQGRWGRPSREFSTCEMELPTQSRAEALVATRRSALPLHFAACWTLADLPRRASKKGAGWWWSMLRHSLDIEKQSNLGGARNDPTEALDRLRLRLAFAQGMRPWLTHWAAGRPGWTDLQVSLPERCPSVDAVAFTLPALQGAIGAALGVVGLGFEERLGMEKLLLCGATVRGNLHRFSGEDRRGRVSELAEQLGMVACKRMMTSAVLA
ncbi:MAG: hypothetical protein ACI8RZ_005647 [Myxococcota bacterium]|jgi:hypothetical protein